MIYICLFDKCYVIEDRMNIVIMFFFSGGK